MRVVPGELARDGDDARRSQRVPIASQRLGRRAARGCARPREAGQEAPRAADQADCRQQARHPSVGGCAGDPGDTHGGGPQREGLAHQAQLLEVGDRILAVNRVKATGHEQTTKLLKDACGAIEIEPEDNDAEGRVAGGGAHVGAARRRRSLNGPQMDLGISSQRQHEELFCKATADAALQQLFQPRTCASAHPEAGRFEHTGAVACAPTLRIVNAPLSLTPQPSHASATVPHTDRSASARKDYENRKETSLVSTLIVGVSCLIDDNVNDNRYRTSAISRSRVPSRPSP